MNVKGKTIFDFCKDEELRKKIIGGDYSKDYYMGFSEVSIYSHLLDYGIVIHDMDLCNAALKARDEAQGLFDRIADEAASKGMLVD